MSKLNFADNTDQNGAATLDTSKFKGLCVTCNYTPTCVRAKHHGQPVWFCEEFDDYTPPDAKSIGTGWKVIDDAKDLTSNVQENTRPVGGLCVNCDTRETCTLSKAKADIWECNEYS